MLDLGVILNYQLKYPGKKTLGRIFKKGGGEVGRDLDNSPRKSANVTHFFNEILLTFLKVGSKAGSGTLDHSPPQIRA